jgi:cell division protein FtsL
MFLFHFVFHLVFWLLSIVFAIQLVNIRRSQKDLFKREFFITKTMVDNKVDKEYDDIKLEKRIASIEAKLEEIIKAIKNAANN